MTRLLEDAFRAASKLPECDQDSLAAAIMFEVEAEAQWEARLRSTPVALEALADAALAHHRAGRSEPLDPERL
jgi:hypothetical protein